MNRKKLLYTFTVARQNINTETTHEFLKENQRTFFSFFKITSDVQNKFHFELSQQQHYPESTILEDTRRTSQTMIVNYPRNSLEIMKMMVSLKQKIF